MNDLKQIQDFFSKPLKENVDKKYNDFLIALRDSGVTNMYGAAPYLEKEFGLNRKEAIEILANWMRSFSKPLKENTTNWPKEVPSRHGDIIFRLVKVMPDRAKYELIDAETGKTWETGGRVYGTVNQLKASAEDTIKPQGGRQSSQFESVNEEIHIPDETIFKMRNGEFVHIDDRFGDKYYVTIYGSKGYDYGKEKELSLKDIKNKIKSGEWKEVKESVNEATEEDKIDIITMDVPLFIRILEYSREDAQTDMDLHDLAEKAIAATKQQGILSMDDYDMLIGDSESLNEQSLDDQAKAYFLAKVKQGEIDTLPEDPKAAFLAQMMKDQMGHDKETLRRERGLEERISKALNELNEELCAKGKRYIKARKRAGEKSSAYLSGRAVKVCKGQIDWPKQGRKKVNESEIDALAKELANAVEDKLEDKKDEINEVLVDPISILSYILAGNTLINIIAKYVGKLFKKYNFGKGEEAAKKIYDFTHKLEQDFKSPIGRVVGLFTKDEKTKNTVTDGLFALLLLGLGAKAGTEAFSAIEKSDFIAGGVNGIKAALKGKDIATLIQNIVSNI
jgi:hypothetical protein